VARRSTPPRRIRTTDSGETREVERWLMDSQVASLATTRQPNGLHHSCMGARTKLTTSSVTSRTGMAHASSDAQTCPRRSPNALLRIPEPFDHPDWLYEIKDDGFHAVAHVEGHRCWLVSRRGHVFAKWDLHARRSPTAPGRMTRSSTMSWCASTLTAVAVSTNCSPIVVTGRTSTRSMSSRSTARISASGRLSFATLTCNLAT
jgi:hypothetical protein